MRKLSLDELNRPSVETYRQMKKSPVTIVLDNIRSALNVGSVFRTADAFACEKIILTGISAKPPHKEIHKSAIGATKSVDWAYHKEISTILTEFKSKGYTIVGVEQTDVSVPLKSYQIKEGHKYVLVFGNELDGLSESILPLLDSAVEIPQWGTKHSLNVSVCAGIVLFHFTSQLL